MPSKLSVISAQNHPLPVINLAGGDIHIFTLNFHKAITVTRHVTERLHVHYLWGIPPPSLTAFILSHHIRCYSDSLVSNRSTLHTFWKLRVMRLRCSLHEQEEKNKIISVQSLKFLKMLQLNVSVISALNSPFSPLRSNTHFSALPLQATYYQKLPSPPAPLAATCRALLTLPWE